MTIEVTISLNPVWQRLAIVNIPGSLTAVAGFTKRLQIPDIASTTFADWIYVIDGKLVKGELLTTHKAMKIIELAKVEPFVLSIRAARLGLAGATVRLITSCRLFAFGRLRVAMIRYLRNQSLLLPFPLGFPFFRLPISFFGSFALFGFSITFLNTLNNRCFGIFAISLLCPSSFMIAFLIFLAFIRVSISSLALLAFICLAKSSLASSTPSLKTIFAKFLCTKFSMWFGFFTPATLLFFDHLASFKQTIKPLIGSIRRTPIASSDLTNEGLDNNNNFSGSAKQKSLYAIGSRYYTIKQVVL